MAKHIRGATARQYLLELRCRILSWIEMMHLNNTARNKMDRQLKKLWDAVNAFAHDNRAELTEEKAEE